MSVCAHPGGGQAGSEVPAHPAGLSGLRAGRPGHPAAAGGCPAAARRSSSPPPALSCTGVEYFTGLFYEKVFRVSFWDYSHLPLNLGGRVCPLFSLLWGILAVLVLKLIHPAAACWPPVLPVWLLPPVLALWGLDTLLTALVLRRTEDTNALRWYRPPPAERPLRGIRGRRKFSCPGSLRPGAARSGSRRSSSGVHRPGPPTGSAPM